MAWWDGELTNMLDDGHVKYQVRAIACREDEMVYFVSSVVRSLWSDSPNHTLLGFKSHQPNSEALLKVFWSSTFVP